MKDFTRFLSTLESALSALGRDRQGLYRTAALTPLHQKLKAAYAQNLRLAAGKVTELDVDVMDDLMKVVKKLSRQSVTTNNGLDTRLKLTLELIQYTMGKTTAAQPDHLLWLFNQIYQGLKKIIPDTATLPGKVGGAV